MPVSEAAWAGLAANLLRRVLRVQSWKSCCSCGSCAASLPPWLPAIAGPVVAYGSGSVFYSDRLASPFHSSLGTQRHAPTAKVRFPRRPRAAQSARQISTPSRYRSINHPRIAVQNAIRTSRSGNPSAEGAEGAWVGLARGRRRNAQTAPRW